MKRRVKRFHHEKGKKSYSYHWIGYQTRNEKGTSYFVREIWEALDKGISIGTISIASVDEEQLSVIPQYQKKLHFT